MAKLKKYQINDEIWTIKGGRWRTPFTVEVIYKGYVVAVNRRSQYNPQFLFIRTYANEVYTGSSRFLKYGVNTKTSIKEYIDGVIKGDYIMEKDTCYPLELILDEGEFIRNERREQVRCSEDVDNL